MAFHVRDTATDTAVRRLARLKRKTLTETIREACEHEYELVSSENPFLAEVRTIQAWFKAHSQPGGKPADKAFFDELSGEDELTGLP
ncbi:MAG TPA: type II toxin-antitoxin system VapB family antitoxin [Stellaceae bacterium]|jgi:antitoxin VapB|nr:type II toxin-antitoxin system VapB family antitoxin [Stellaceae bacterium]